MHKVPVLLGEGWMVGCFKGWQDVWIGGRRVLSALMGLVQMPGLLLYEAISP